MLTNRTIDLCLPRPFAWQRQVQAEARRFNCVAVGRRAGKSTMSYELLMKPSLAGYPSAYFAPTYKRLGEAWRSVQNTLSPVTKRANASEHRIELVTGGSIEMWSLEDKDAGRSRKYKRVVIDEAGLVHDLGDRWNEAIRPTLADYAGDLWALGTPNGQNYFWQMFNWGQDTLLSDWASWQMPTSVNPLIAAAEIEDMQRTMPDASYRQEILAEFNRNEGSVFRNIDACMLAPVDATPEQHAGHEFVAGLDWAMKHDFTCLSVVCVTCRCEVELVRFNQIGWAIQRDRVVTTCRKWNPFIILAESNSIGSPNIEALAEQDDLPVQGFETTASSKPQLIKSMALALERVEMQWLPDPAAKAEMVAYESTISAATGRASYSAPEGGHDDTVISRALALKASSSWGSLQ